MVRPEVRHQFLETARQAWKSPAVPPRVEKFIMRADGAALECAYSVTSHEGDRCHILIVSDMHDLAWTSHFEGLSDWPDGAVGIVKTFAPDAKTPEIRAATDDDLLLSLQNLRTAPDKQELSFSYPPLDT